MPTRRAIIRWFGLGLAALATRAWAGVKRRLLARDTPRRTLSKVNPKRVDASQLAVTPLSAFETMGPTEYPVDMAAWRLHVGGAVDTPMTLSYDQITALPAIERKVLMVCPGIFANTGIWKGVPIGTLLDMAGADPTADYVVASSPKTVDHERRRFAMDDIRTNRVFLAHSVNGVPLPVQNGYPLRIVSENDYGDSWLKFVDRIDVNGPPTDRQSRK